MKKRKYSWRDPYNSNGYPPLVQYYNGGFDDSDQYSQFGKQTLGSVANSALPGAGSVLQGVDSTSSNLLKDKYGEYNSKGAGALDMIINPMAKVNMLSDLFSGVKPGDRKREAEKEEFENRIMQAKAKFSTTNAPRVANIPTFPGGGTLVTPRTEGNMAQRARYINNIGDINDPRLYQSPDSIGHYATVLLRPKDDMQQATVNDLFKSYINNWNQRFGKDKGYFIDPNNAGVRHIEQDNPLYKTMENQYKTIPNSWNTFYTPPKPTVKFRSGEGTKGYESGGYTIDYKGASHKGGGIPVDSFTGNPSYILGGKPGAEVEGNEIGVKFPNEESPFIFSDKLGYSDKARKVIKKYSRRPNDKISQDAMYMELGGIANSQEEYKKGLDEHMNSVEYRDGGSIHIKPENKGKFTDWANTHGMGVQEAAKHVMAHKDKYSSTIIKRANFAKNAANWKHELGGGLEGVEFERGGELPEWLYEARANAIREKMLEEGGELEFNYSNGDETEYAKGGWIKKAVNPAHKGYCTPMTKSTCTGRRRALALTFKKHHGFHKKEDGGELEQYCGGGCMDCGGKMNCGGYMKAIGGTLNSGLPKYEYGDPINVPKLPQFKPETEEDSPYRGNALGLVGTVGANLALLLANRNNRLPDIQSPTISPELINLEGARTSARQQGVTSRANRIAALRNSGISPTQYASVLPGVDTDIDEGVNNTILDSLSREEQFNAQAKQQSKLTNISNYLNTQLANRENENAYKRQNMQYWQNIAQAIPQYLQQKEKYDVLNATNENYNIIKDPNAPWYNPRPKFKVRTR